MLEDGFSAIDWQVIRIDDQPISQIENAEPLPVGEIGELIVRGPAITRCYVTRTEVNSLAKISDGATFWHRIGDVGYFDDFGRFWFCGRKAHRVTTTSGTLFPVRCEAIFNEHESIYRSALVGIGLPNEQTPVLVAEPWPGKMPATAADQQELCQELFQLGQANPLTSSIKLEHLLLHPSLPVDIRHNAKIFREQLGPWAEDQLSSK